VTTLIVGLALLIFGSGAIRGFAVVHCLGILTSIFSSVFVSRGVVNLWYGRKKKLAFSIGQVWKPQNRQIPHRQLNKEAHMELFRIKRHSFHAPCADFQCHFRTDFCGSSFFLLSKSLHFSVEFTGGTVLEVSYSKAADINGIRRWWKNWATSMRHSVKRKTW
jgi:preprotein translocase subunit SecF